MKEKVLGFIKSSYKKIFICSALVIVAAILFVELRGTLSNNDHSNYVYIFSDKTNYLDGDPGGWILYKDAHLVDEKTLDIRYKINSNNLLTEKDKDVLFMIDTSEASMSQICDDYSSGPVANKYGNNSKNRINLLGDFSDNYDSCIPYKIDTAINDLIYEEVNLDNKISLMTFNDDYELLSGLTDDYSALSEKLYNIVPKGYTDYSKAIEGIDYFLSNYTFINDRELKIVLFIGNVSKGSVERERQLFNDLKQRYPNITVNAIHNVVDNEVILEKIKNISDRQFLACELYNFDYAEEKNNFFTNGKVRQLSSPVLLFRGYSINNIFSQIILSKEFSQFKIIDNINTDYFNFNSFKVVEKNNGEVGHDNSSLTWTLDRNMLSGDYVYLEVLLGINDNILLTDNYVPVSNSSSIKSILTGIPDEEINTNLSPFVKFRNNVYYVTSMLPESCNAQEIPSEQYDIDDIVDINQKIPNCDGYKFIKWVINYEDYRYNYFDSLYDNVITLGLNNNSDKLLLTQQFDPSNADEPYFINGNPNLIRIIDGRFKMPGFDVILYPLFESASISKNIDNMTATLESGESFNYDIGVLVGNKSEISKIKKADSMGDVTSIVISDKSSDVPVYAWFDSTDKTLYYYSEAEKIYLNKISTSMFNYFNRLEDISGLEYLDASQVERANSMFANCYKLADLSPISNWDVSKIQHANSMFMYCSALTNLEALSNWNVSNIIYVDGMFSSSGITSLSGLENWNTSRVNSFSRMFDSASKLVDISAIETWNVSNAVYMNEMFRNTPITNIDSLAGWNIEKLRNIDGMFELCKKLVDISALSSWDVSKIEYMSALFKSCIKLEDISPLSAWNLTSVYYIDNMFNGCTELEDISALANWNTIKVESISGMFMNCSKISDLSPLVNWKVSNVENMNSVFYNMPLLTSLSGLENWNVSKVKTMDYLFYAENNLTNISALANWNTSNVTILSHLFEGCSALTDISPLSNWNTKNVTTFSSMFADCINLNSLSSISNWNIKRVRDFSYMFGSCTSLTSLNGLENWDVSNAEIFSYMFRECTNLNDVSALNNWNIPLYGSYQRMFYNVSVHPTFSKIDGTWDSEGTFLVGGDY